MYAKRDRRIATIAFFMVLVLVVLAVGSQLSPARPFPRSNEQIPASEDTQTMQARVVRVIRTDPAQASQLLELEIVDGTLRGIRAETEYSVDEMNQDGTPYHAGDHVLVSVTTRDDGGRMVMISDYRRTGALAFLTVVFIAFTVLISGWKGVRSLIGLAISFIVLMGFVLPQVLAGRDPVLVSVTGAFVLLTITLYLTQGWALKTHAAMLGSLLSLILIGLFCYLGVALTRLTGFGSEDALLLQVGNPINLRGLLLAGMIIGTLGVLDDVVISQASAVTELAEANAALGWQELYRRAMNIGRDHIAATVNTLVMAYVGAAMPLLLLFQLYPEPWQYTINREIVAEEIVRTLVGSLGLLAAVPITTLITSLLRHWRNTRTTDSQITAPESLGPNNHGTH